MRSANMDMNRVLLGDCKAAFGIEQSSIVVHSVWTVLQVRSQNLHIVLADTTAYIQIANWEVWESRLGRRGRGIRSPTPASVLRLNLSLPSPCLLPDKGEFACDGR